MSGQVMNLVGGSACAVAARSAKKAHMTSPVVAKLPAKASVLKSLDAIGSRAPTRVSATHAPRMSKLEAKRAAITTCAVAVEVPAATMELEPRDEIRNIAIIAHVDHGKTSLVDSMLKQAKVFRDNQKMEERVMDSNDLERERGITILAKNTAITYGKYKINIIDTPGHSDFGGEVERVLNMCDGVLLLVDSVEGPMPQTRFVLKKALQLKLKVVVVVNKIDRPSARPAWVYDTTFDLFCELGASDEQCDFPVVYASGLLGKAGLAADTLEDTLAPLFDTVVSQVPPPMVAPKAPLQILVTNLDYDEHKGRICIGRVNSGEIKKGQSVAIMVPGMDKRMGRVAELFVYSNFSKVPVDSVSAGDICALTGLSEAKIGETIACPANGTPLPRIEVEEPTVRMTFYVNNSPFAGQEGKFVTSRNLRERLYNELERNLAMRVVDGETADQFIVSGRGSLHITITIENMRREGYEFQVGPPSVILKEVDGTKCEPFEMVEVDVPEGYMGSVVDLLASRKGEMQDMVVDEGGTAHVKYRMPTRGLLGLRNTMLTATKGTAVLNSILLGYSPYAGDFDMRQFGSLIASEQGQSTQYALLSSQDRGLMFVAPGEQVYPGMVVGQHQRPGDLKMNVCKAKAMTNVRSNKDATQVLKQAKVMNLDDAVEYIAQDEIVEVTPMSIRMRKNPAMQKK